MFEFIHKPDEEDKYKHVAKNLGVDIGFRYEHRKFYARVNHCSIKDFTRELQRVIQEEKMYRGPTVKYATWELKGEPQFNFYTNFPCDDYKRKEAYREAARKLGIEIQIRDKAYVYGDPRYGGRLLNGYNSVWIPAGITGFYDTVQEVMKMKSTLITPEDVQRRLDAGEDPLMVSIDHWMENVRWLKEEKELPSLSYGAETCALCSVYQDPHSCPACAKCILYKVLGKGCGVPNSPWQNFVTERTLSNAIAMLNALLSCLEYEPEPEKQFYIWQEGKEPEGKVGLRLEYNDEGIVLRASRSDLSDPSTLSKFPWTLLEFKQDGTIRRTGCLPPILGLNLDSMHKIKFD